MFAASDRVAKSSGNRSAVAVMENATAARAMPDFEAILARQTGMPFLAHTQFQGPSISALACPFNSIGTADVLEFVGEHAFDEFLSSDPTVEVRVSHDPRFVLASNADHSLTLSKGPFGLMAEFSVDQHNRELGEVIVHLMANDAHLLRGASIAIDASSSDYVMHEYNRQVIREWTRVSIRELSLASRPAYATCVSLRADRVPNVMDVNWRLRSEVLELLTPH